MTGPRGGAYVHVPFCAHRCAYCSFVAQAGLEGEEAYFDAVAAEALRRAGEVPGPLETVYFGGGTPSFVPPERLGLVLAALRDAFGISGGAEVTVEANPDDLGDGALEALRRTGASRLSIGVQSLSDAELAPLERRHDAAAARTALRRAVGVFRDVSADLMIGIPGQTRESLRASLEGLLEAGVAHVSVYLLEIEKAARLVALRRERPELFADDDEVAERWELVDDALARAGLPRYEVSNWAVPGRESRHNRKYWTQEPTLGLGVAAHSFDGAVRRANTGSLPEYLRRVGAGAAAVVSEVRLEPAEAVRERALLGLRLAEGIEEALFSEASATASPEDRARLADAEAAGLLERAAGRVRLSRRGVLLSSEVFAALL